MDPEVGYLQPKEEKETLQINSPHPPKKPILSKNYTESNFISRFFYFWANPAISLANKRPLEKEDVCQISESQKVSKNFEKFKQIFDKQSKDKLSKYPLFMSIIKVHYKKIIFLFILNMIDVGLEYIRIFFFKKIISIFSEGDFFPHRELSWYNINTFNYKFNIIESITIFIFIKLLASLLYNLAEFESAILNRVIINETSALLMEKLLKSNSINNTFAKGEGEKINLIEIDAEKIGFFFFWAPKIITFPIKICISLYLLFNIFGHLFIYALLGLLVVLSIIIFFQKIYDRNIKYLLQYKDKRMKIVTYVFQVLKNIKLNNLDDEFIKRIDQKRDEEMKMLSTQFNLEVTIGVLNKNLNLILIILTLSIFVASKDQLEISSLFASFQLINTIAIPLMIIPIFLAQLIGNLVSINRIQAFLSSEEHYSNNKKYIDDNNTMIKFENVSFSVKNNLNINKYKTNFNLNLTNNIINNTTKNIKLLENISFTAKVGDLIGVLGPTGAGKTCLLNAIMNNYQIDESKSIPKIYGEISFTPSQPWIMTESIKNNIIFFGEKDEKKYNKIVNLCGLKTDFEKLTDSDNTMVNSTCSNISEGQKLRISLARTLYQNKDIYLIDDIFSSLDKNISQQIFKNVICNYLKNKTRIVVLKDKNYIPFVDKIIYLEKGKITFFGTYEKFKEYSMQKEEKEDNITNDKNDINFNNTKRKYSDELDKNNSIDNDNILINYKNADDYLNSVSRNKISTKTYLFYIQLQGGFLIFIILTILITIVKGMELYRSTIIPRLARSYKEISKTHQNLNSRNNNSNLAFMAELKKNFNIFLKISIGTIIINFIIRFTVTRISIYAMRNIHKQMIQRLVKAPINLFHDVVPVGQILNRLTQDIEIIQNIIRTVNSFIKLLFSLATCMIICYIYNKSILILTPIIAFYIIILTAYYLTAGRNLTRLQRISYSPIMTIFSETIRGLDIIRTAHAEKNTKRKFFEKIDDRYGIYLFGEGCKRWHDVRRSIFIQIVFGVTILYMAYYSEFYSVRAIAIILQYTEEFLLYLINISLFYIELENSMIGLERCEQILKIPQEKEISKKNNILLSENWSKKGEIEFINYSASYRPNTPEILKKINLNIKSNEKVAIMGCSGGGKSSLINALTRIIEPKNGKILIDNVDIQDLNLNFLRDKITILPQEYFLIESTLKDNIDPLNKNSDEDVLKIINDLKILKNLDNDKKLNFEIKENGNNLSTGEKKLICFARGIIKKNKIFIMDELVSSLDDEIKKIICDNIIKYLKECTLIMITNQLDMIKMCNRIIVIEDGRIIEDGKMEDLLNDKNSIIQNLIIS
jgi:ABC-type multidrug transport system fused ATPase/permease subunit